MNEMLSESDLDFVRRVSKEVICCLLPDELPFFDVIWQASEPLLRQPARVVVDEDSLGLIRDRLKGLGFAAEGSADAVIISAAVMKVLTAALEEARRTGVRSDGDISLLVAKHGLPWSLPDRFLRMIKMFLQAFCCGVADPDPETQEFLQRARPLAIHTRCYCVFHHGEDHFYPGQLPPQVLALRQTVLFWIYRQEADLCSLGERQARSDWLPGHAERVLRVLCSAGHAKKRLPFSQLFAEAWSRPPASHQKMVGSVEVAENLLNRFAGKKFMGENAKWVDRIRGEDEVEISAETPQVCCIINHVELPTLP